MAFRSCSFWLQPFSGSNLLQSNVFTRLLLSTLGVALLFFAWPAFARADGPIPPGAYGYDISYPQCPTTVPAGAFGFGIIGVNNGRAMTQNPCIPAQLAWAKKGAADPSVYINTNSPPAGFQTALCVKTDRICIAFEYGRQAAAYAVSYVDRHSPGISRYWLDVETENTWSTDTHENASVLRGMLASLTGAGKSVGIYSTSYQFTRIAGSFSPGLDNWVPRPEAKRDTAAAFCRTTPPFGGGRVVMIQLWYTFDENYACPAQNSSPIPPATTFKAGDIAVVAPSGGCLNLRGGTGVTFPILECLNEGVRVSVTGPPVMMDSYNWVPVTAPSGKSGWAAAEYLERAPTALEPAPTAPAPPAPRYRIVLGNLAGG